MRMFNLFKKKEKWVYDTPTLRRNTQEYQYYDVRRIIILGNGWTSIPYDEYVVKAVNQHKELSESVRRRKKEYLEALMYINKLNNER